MEPIEVIGIDLLDDLEKNILNKLTNEYRNKIERELKNLTSLVVHIKKQSKGGKKKRYSVHSRVIAPTRIFEASASDWDLPKTLHMVFNALEKEIQHKLRHES